MKKQILQIRLREGQYEYDSTVGYPSTGARVSLVGTGGTRAKAFGNLLFSMRDEKIWDFSDKLEECVNLENLTEGAEEKDGNNIYYFFIVELNCTHEEFEVITKKPVDDGDESASRDDYDLVFVNNFFNPLLISIVNLEESIQMLIKSLKSFKISK